MEYRVLARKYRPTSFADLVGQEALVRTLSNAIRLNRIAHAFLLTGIRGIGKTTTARIIARALNCVGADGQGGATIEPCGVCPNCKMIAEDRHPDVLEMDAASHTGVNDIRDLIETVRYLPTSARAKIYIIDEVHMLSNSAFNALLKTLEEPPPHVKFIFATTEARKIPVTILSRCQRFDLSRLDTEALAAHLGNVAAKENVAIEPEALTLLSIAAEGSVRDGLSLLDRAIAHGDGEAAISADQVRAMLGLADRSQTLLLLRELLSGNSALTLRMFRELYEKGADPALVLQDCLELTHFITRVKLVPESADDPAFSPHEREQARQMAGKLSMPALSRLWQMLLKGVSEMKQAPSPVAAGEMILARIAFASDLPTPAELIQTIQRNPVAAMPTRQADAVSAPVSPMPVMDSAPRPQPAQPAAPALVPMPQDFPAMVALFERQREALLASQLRQFASLVSYAPGKVELHMQSMLSREFPAKVAQLMQEWTGQEWKILLSDKPGAPTLEAQETERKEQEKQAARDHPLVASILEQFPGAEVAAVKEMA